MKKFDIVDWIFMAIATLMLLALIVAIFGMVIELCK